MGGEVEMATWLLLPTRSNAPLLSPGCVLPSQQLERTRYWQRLLEARKQYTRLLSHEVSAVAVRNACRREGRGGGVVPECRPCELHHSQPPPCRHTHRICRSAAPSPPSRWGSMTCWRTCSPSSSRHHSAAAVERRAGPHLPPLLPSPCPSPWNRHGAHIPLASLHPFARHGAELVHPCALHPTPHRPLAATRAFPFARATRSCSLNPHDAPRLRHQQAPAAGLAAARSIHFQSRRRQLVALPAQ